MRAFKNHDIKCTVTNPILQADVAEAHSLLQVSK